MSAQIFQNDDDAYRAWISANPTGFVLNTTSVPSAQYLMLHKATCGCIGSPDIENYTTTAYIKICSISIDDLNGWGKREIGGNLTPCGLCHPLTSPNQGGVV